MSASWLRYVGGMTSSLTPSDVASPPLDDEFELSVFGPGVGEGLVVHLGEDQWMVVDSCLDPDSAEPVALKYLRTLNGRNPRIVAAVLTHWHDDHTAGAARVLRAAPDAQFVCSTAFRAEELRRALEIQLVGRLERSGLSELSEVFELLKEREQSPMLAVANRELFATAHCTVRALSPGDRTMWNAFAGLAQYMILPAQPRRRLPRHTQNDASIVLWVEFGEHRVPLGGDLETRVGRRSLPILSTLAAPQYSKSHTTAPTTPTTISCGRRCSHLSPRRSSRRILRESARVLTPTTSLAFAHTRRTCTSLRWQP
jgi:hypothetical protein